MSKINREIKKLLCDYVRIEREAICGEIIPEHTFSKAYYDKIDGIAGQTESRASYSISLRRILTVAAIVTLLAALAISVCAVVRDRFSAFRSVDRGTEIDYYTNEGDSEADEVLLEPGFIPEGFKIDKVYKSPNGIMIQYSNEKTVWVYSQDPTGCNIAINTEGCDSYYTKNIGEHTVHIRLYYGRYTQMYWATEKYIFILNFNDLETVEYADEIILSLQEAEEKAP